MAPESPASAHAEGYGASMGGAKSARQHWASATRDQHGRQPDDDPCSHACAPPPEAVGGRCCGCRRRCRHGRPPAGMGRTCSRLLADGSARKRVGRTVDVRCHVRLPASPALAAARGRYRRLPVLLLAWRPRSRGRVMSVVRIPPRLRRMRTAAARRPACLSRVRPGREGTWVVMGSGLPLFLRSRGGVWCVHGWRSCIRLGQRNAGR